MLESAVQEFQKRYQLPGIFRVIDWHRGVREFFRPVERGGQMGTNFVHADESETSLSLLLHPEMVDMNYAVDTEGKILPARRPLRQIGRSVWSPEPLVGRRRATSPSKSPPPPKAWSAKPNPALPRKAKRPMAAILKYLTLWHDDMLEAFPAGKVPPVEEVTLRTEAEMEPYLREPLSPGWKPVYGLPRIGQGTEV